MRKNLRLNKVAGLLLAINLILPFVSFAGLSGEEAGLLELIKKSEYNIVSEDNISWSSPNREQNLRFHYRPNSLEIQPRDAESNPWNVNFSILGIYSGMQSLFPTNEAAVLSDEAYLSFDHHGAFTVEYLNGQAGMRQNFVLKQDLDKASGFRIVLDIETSLQVSDLPGNSIEFRNASACADEPALLRYDDLKVWDATGKALSASMAICNDQLVISVDDIGAVYPVTVDPVSTSPAWSYEGTQEGAFFGYSVSRAGDVNNDGFDDVIIGAYGFDGGELNEGKIFVFHGSSAGLSLTPNFVREMNSENSRFGFSVSCAGDVNNDGFDDVIVGAPYFPVIGTPVGKAWVFRGSATGLAMAPAWSQEGQVDNAQYGASVACAGDVDNDGFDDILVGATGHSNGQISEGRVYAYYGSPTGPSLELDWAAESNQSFSNFGVSISSAGDVDNDGYDDVIIGADNYDFTMPDVGLATIFRGSAIGLKNSPSWFVSPGLPGSGYGVSVCGAGDLNGDGFSDVAVGANLFTEGQTREGAVFVYYGSEAGPAVTPDFIFQSNRPNARLGISVSCAGDTNGDGFGDLIVGAEKYSAELVDVGAVYLFEGSEDGLPGAPGSQIIGTVAGAGLGYCVSGAGDVNNDGNDDILAGAPYMGASFANGGAAYLYLGNDVVVPDCDPMTSVPMNLSANLISPTQVVLNWDAIPGAFGYQVKGRILGTTGFASTVSTTNSKAVNGLSPGTTYEWYLRAACMNPVSNPETITGYSDFDTFTMPSMKVAYEAKTKMRIFPQPADEYASLMFISEQSGRATFELIDISGRVIESRVFGLNGGTNIVELDLTDLTSGIYIARVIYEGGQQSMQLIRN